MATRFWSFRAALLVFLMFNSWSLFQILDDSVLDTPLQEVELGARRRKSLEFYTLRPAKRVKELLAVPVQTRLVGYVNRDHLPSGCRVRHVVRLGIVGHEPLEFAKGNTLAVSQNIVKLFAILWYIKEFGETGQKNLRLAHYFFRGSKPLTRLPKVP